MSTQQPRCGVSQPRRARTRSFEPCGQPAMETSATIQASKTAQRSTALVSSPRRRACAPRALFRAFSPPPRARTGDNGNQETRQEQRCAHQHPLGFLKRICLGRVVLVRRRGQHPQRVRRPQLGRHGELERARSQVSVVGQRRCAESYRLHVGAIEGPRARPQRTRPVRPRAYRGRCWRPRRRGCEPAPRRSVERASHGRTGRSCSHGRRRGGAVSAGGAHLRAAMPLRACV